MLGGLPCGTAGVAGTWLVRRTAGIAAPAKVGPAPVFRSFATNPVAGPEKRRTLGG